MNGRELIARKGPRGRRPDKKIDVVEPRICAIVDQWEPNKDRRIGNAAVPLPDFAARKGGSPLSPPPDDLMSLVKEPLVEERLERPPDRFDKRLMERHIGVIEIDPEPEPFGQFFPLLCVTKDVLNTVVNERFDTVRLDLFLRVNPQFFTDFDLDRQTVGIPTGFPFAEKPFHRLIAGIEVFNRAGQAMSGMGKPVRGRRSLVKNKFATVLQTALFERFLVNIPLPPAADQFFFILRKISAGSVFVNCFTRHW